jgi:hypothetical protein
MAVRSWAGRKVPRREKLTARSYTATFCDDLLTMAIEAESRATPDFLLGSYSTICRNE